MPPFRQGILLPARLLFGGPNQTYDDKTMDLKREGSQCALKVIPVQDDAYSIHYLSDAIHTLPRKGGQPGYIVKGARSPKFDNADCATLAFRVTPDVGFIRRDHRSPSLCPDPSQSPAQIPD